MPYNFNAITGKLDLVIDPGTISLGDLNPKDHDLLDGLGDDDHPQYHNDARADTWFAGKDLSDLGTKNHADLDLLLADDHTQYALLLGRSGGQTLIGGTGVASNLTLQANTIGGGGSSVGRIIMKQSVQFDSISATGADYAFNYAATENYGVSFVGGGLNMSGDITFGNSTFIYESFRGAPTIRTAANPGFAAYTVLQALPLLIAGPGAGNNPLAPLILNAGATVRQPYIGTRTVSSVTGINFASTLNPTASGATLNCTNWIGIAVAPTWNTVSGSVCSFGNIKGIVLRAPSQALFGSSAGVERLSSFYGLEVEQPSINNGFGTAPMAAVRSEITKGTNRYFLLNSGGAHSFFGSSNLHINDNYGVAYGGSSVNNFDSFISWNGPGNYHRTYFNSTASALRWTSPANNRFLFDNDGGNATGEYNFNCAKFSMGGQTGSVGNQVGVFVTPARATNVGGGWSDFLLTQAANLTINHAMGSVAAWTLNAVVLTLGAGSISDYVATLDIGSMTSSGLGSAKTHALRIQGRRTSRGVDAFEPLSPAQITADIDDYQPATFASMRQVWRLDSDASRTITGIAVQQEDDTQIIINIGSNDIVLADQNVSSTATNRIISPTGVDLTLGPDEYAYLWHDNVTDRWRILETNGS